MEVSTEQVECPVCGQYANVHDLGRAGLTPEELLRIRQYVKDGTLGKMLIIADMVSRRMDPTSTSMELSFNDTLERFGMKSGEKLDQLVRLLNGISEKIVGPGIGDVSEMIAAEELRQAFPQDEFDRSAADQHGTDIVAKVYDRKDHAGAISISVKETKHWKNEFVEQLEKNMNQDSTKLGILITKKLPKGTNPTGQVVHSNNQMLFLVHPQYALAVYAGLREVVIHMHESEQYIITKEQELMQIGRISKALVKWISGNEYQEIQNTLGEINTNSEETDGVLLQMQDYVERHVKKASEKQKKIRQQVLNAGNLLTGLKELLKSPSTYGDEEK